MGRLIIILAILLVLILLWKAFGPQSWNSRQQPKSEEKRPIGPDDDPDFLWTLKKKEFEKKRREQRELERAQRELAARTKAKAQSEATDESQSNSQPQRAGGTTIGRDTQPQAQAETQSGIAITSEDSASDKPTEPSSPSREPAATSTVNADKTDNPGAPKNRAGAESFGHKANKGGNPVAKETELSTESVDNTNDGSTPEPGDDNCTHGESV